MKIDEVVVYPDRNTNIEKYNQYFQNSNTVKAFDGLFLVRNIEADHDYLGLITQDKLVSILHLNFRNDMWQITYAQSEPDFQNQGCFRYLITAAVSTHDSILSDDHQTDKSKKAWQSLIKYPGPGIEIFVFDTSTKAKLPSQNVPEDKIWNNQTNPVLLISKSNNAETTDRNNVMTALKETIGIDRTIKGIWYGKNSSTSNYINP